jgi:hypothetical protein
MLIVRGVSTRGQVLIMDRGLDVYRVEKCALGREIRSTCHIAFMTQLAQCEDPVMRSTVNAKMQENLVTHSAINMYRGSGGAEKLTDGERCRYPT